VYKSTAEKALPVGAAFCTKHRKIIFSAKEEENKENDPNPPTCSTPDADADDHVPDEPMISVEAIENATTSANSLCDASVMSPLSFQIRHFS